MDFQNCVVIRCISSENMTVVWNVKNVRDDQCKVNSICKPEKQKDISISIREDEMSQWFCLCVDTKENVFIRSCYC